MRTTVVVHATGWASYVRWVEALRRWCRGVGQGMTAEMIDESALDALEVSQGQPSGAKYQATKPNGDRLWTWRVDSHTVISYLVRDEVAWLGKRRRRVIILDYETTLPDGSS